MHKKFVYPLFAPEDMNGGFSGGESDDEMVSADVDLLEDGGESSEDGEEDKETPDDESESENVEDEQTDEDSESDGDDESEKEEEVEEEKPEESEETEDGLPEPLRFSQIKKEYPDFFKKFPQFKGMVQGYYNFTQLFNSVEEAKEATEVVQNYNAIASDIFNGKADSFLESIKQANSQGYSKFVRNILPGLFATDQKAYFEVASPIVDGVFRNLYTEGVKEGNKNKVNSALIAYSTTFGSSLEEAQEALKGKPKGFKEPEKTEREVELEKRNQDLLKTNFEAVSRSVDSEIGKSLEAEFLKGAGADWSPAEKRVFLEDCFKEIRKVLNEDKAHSGRMSVLWKKEESDGYKGRNADSIKKAVLSRAASVIPSIRLKVKKEMGKLTQKPGQKKDGKNLNLRDKNRNVPAGKQSNFSGRKVTAKTNPRSIDWKSSSDMDILNDNATFKR